MVFEYVGEYQNTLELDIHRRGHRIYVRVGEEGVHFLIDETDPPIEQTVPLSELGSLEAFYDCVRKFVLEHS